MTRYLITLEIENGFYQEAYEEGMPMPKLLEELQLDIQDQLEEYDFQQLMKRLISSDSQDDVVIFAPKKNNESAPVFSFVGALRQAQDRLGCL